MELEQFAEVSQRVGEYLKRNENPAYDWVWAGGQGGELNVPGGGSLSFLKRRGKNTQQVLISAIYPDGYEQPRHRGLDESIQPEAIRVSYGWKTETIARKICEFVTLYQPHFAEACAQKARDDEIEAARAKTALALIEMFPGLVNKSWNDNTFTNLSVKDVRVRELRVDAADSIRVTLNNIPFMAVCALLDALQAQTDDENPSRPEFVYTLLHKHLRFVLTMAEEAHQFYQNDPIDGYDEELAPGAFEEAKTSLGIVGSFVRYLEAKKEQHSERETTV